MWTQFYAMHSGGSTKEPPAEVIYIEAPEEQAAVMFHNFFGHSPDRVTCTCCGADYSYNNYADDESECTLTQLTAYERNCLFDNDSGKYSEMADPDHQKYGPHKQYQTLDEYLLREDVIILPIEAFDPEDLKGDWHWRESKGVSSDD